MIIPLNKDKAAANCADRIYIDAQIKELKRYIDFQNRKIEELTEKVNFLEVRLGCANRISIKPKDQ